LTGVQYFRVLHKPKYIPESAETANNPELTLTFY